jgi:tRNA pseudouridine55 synthase
METSGILLINKKTGLTTVQQESVVKHTLGIKKAGHAGTLDPFASGLILLGINKGTKTLSFFEDKGKSYSAVLQLGFKTATGDPEGEKTEEKKPDIHSKEEIIRILNSFMGDSTQIPPMYSALKKDGVPLYKLAREGKEIEREPRKIHISKIALTGYDETENTISFDADVSKGTYIRVLAEDIAAKLGEKGHLISLVRTRIGNFTLSQAVLGEAAKESDIIPIKNLFPNIYSFQADPELQIRIKNGADIKAAFADSPALIMPLDNQGEAMAIYQKSDDDWYRLLKEFI